MSTAHRFALAPGCAEPPLRYTLAGGRIGVTDNPSYLRTLADAAFWLGMAPLPIRLLWRLGANRHSRCAQRWWARSVSRRLAVRIDWQGST